ncbi:frv operon regulatory protein [Ligilactobacillus salitolerans]|uniref:Frv operon regulatory protein n=1 Tax=Ligilactobacillus salitolerans TaxID=1808352 RepID=A0A401ISQ3_9LACO|nr:frv operon regulatory protein [Ligilactobacillus salitolerans]
MREIKRINDTLQKEKTGSVQTSQIYHLVILNKEKFHVLLNESVPDEYLILFKLLVQEKMGLDDLAESCFMSKKRVLHCLALLNARYQQVFVIKTVQRRGILIQVKVTTRIDLLASLLQRFPDLLNLMNSPAQDKLSQELQQLLGVILPEFNQVREFITRVELEQQVKACVLLATSCSASGAKSEIKDRLQNCYLGKVALYHRLTEEKENLWMAIWNCLLQYQTAETKICNLIYLHVVRAAIFPSIFSELPENQRKYIQASDPLAFDLAEELRLAINGKFPQIYVNQSFLVIYALMAFKEQERHNKQKILLISDSNALGAINKMLLQQALKNAECTLEVGEEIQDQEQYDLTILSGKMVSDSGISKSDYFFEGILGDQDIEKIKTKLSDKYYGRICRQELSGSHILKYTSTSDHFLEVFTNCLQRVEDQGQISSKGSEALLTRESAGNQLVIGSVAVPHIVSNEIRQPYSILAVLLEKPVFLDEQKVTVILIMVVNRNVKDKGGIFKYLYREMKNIINVVGYETET